MEECSSSSIENDPYTTPDTTPMQLKRKGRFRIDLYAKRKKLFTDEYLKEKIEATEEVKRLKAQISYAKKKSNDLKENLDVKHQTIKKAKKESVSLEKNSDQLNLSRVQEFRRRKATMEVLTPLHCNSGSKSQKPVIDGMWSTLVNQSSTDDLTCKIQNSQTCMKKIIPKIMREKIKEYNNSNANFTRSIMLLYKGGILTKTKYKEMTKTRQDFVDGITIPRPVAYDRLQAFIKGINMGEVNDLQEFASKVGKPGVYGVFRPLEGFLIQLAGMYLTLNEHNQLLHWFNGEEGKFKIAMGADGAPFGKDETATAFLVSVLNVLDGVQSCNNNFMLMGAVF